MDMEHSLEYDSVHTKNLNRFIAKTYRIINSDEPTACWVQGGKSFLILDPRKFSKTVLPKYFKHSKFSSFVRQLNFYGFRKLRIQAGPLLTNENTENRDDRSEEIGSPVCFHHEFFQANQPKLLYRIERNTKKTIPIILSESPTPMQTQQKEIESFRQQLEDMKNYVDNMRDEFEMKLASARTEMEINYLRRINSIEARYKELVSMILYTKNSSAISPWSLEQNRLVSSLPIAGDFRPVIPLSSTTTRTRSNKTNDNSLAGLLPQNLSKGEERMSCKIDASGNKTCNDTTVEALIDHLLRNDGGISPHQRKN